jgi:adenylate cyclase
MGICRVEMERPLDVKEFRTLWRLTLGRRLRKRRYQLRYAYTDRAGYRAQCLIELDRFLGPLRGLYIAEVEFRSLARSEMFVAPPWFGPEVTGRLEFSNRALAAEGMPGGCCALLRTPQT